MISLLFLMACGAMGVALRHFCNLGVARMATWMHFGAPLATLGVNVVGAFLAGAILLGFRGSFSQEIQNALVVGFLGGLTTFSSYSVESLRLAEQGRWGLFAVYFVGSPILGVAAAAAGACVRRALGS